MNSLYIKNRFISWDFFTALALTVGLYFIVPEQIELAFALDLYVVGITVITMCIFYFLAVLALLVSASDEDFILYLQKQNVYTSVFNTYQYTIFILFLALIYSLIMYGIASYMKYILPGNKQSQFFFLGFLFLFAYAIFTAFESSLDSVHYLKVRVKFMALKRLLLHQRQVNEEEHARADARGEHMVTRGTEGHAESAAALNMNESVFDTGDPRTREALHELASMKVKPLRRHNTGRSKERSIDKPNQNTRPGKKPERNAIARSRGRSPGKKARAVGQKKRAPKGKPG
ncbi:MAG: hypothetical protein KDK30_13290 [Leptospiraceae bacterium]|nr:hypothetical protein [Leptospiraceae bacterium]